jgi:small-conductance mechanosensitive channel
VKQWVLKDQKSRQSWIRFAKRLPSLILFFGVLFVWGEELRDFALSLVAVAAALVLATKEVILCFMGGLLKASTKLFEIGDRITIAGYRGKVVEQTLMTTTLAEIGPSLKSNQLTGKLIKVPNSLFLSQSVSLVPSHHDFTLHVISITLPLNADWETLDSLLMESALEVMETYKLNLEKFIKKNSKIVKENSVGIEPRVSFELNSKDTIEFTLRLLVPYESLSKTESLIVRNFMKKIKSIYVFKTK